MHAAKRAPKTVVRLLATILAVLMLFPAPLVTTSAKASVFNFGIKDEKELGDKFNVLVRSKLPMIEDSEIVDYVRGIVDRLVRQMPPQPFVFKTAVVQDNAINAFAAPAGYVFVFTGLLLNMDHESEVAGVLAHECAHVTQRHVAKRIEQSAAISIASLAGVLAGFVLGQATGQRDAGAALMIGSQAGATQAMLNYSRTDEREADEVGMNYLVAAGYPPRGLPMAFDVLNRMRIFTGSGSLPTYLSTHPGLAERVGYLNERIARMPKNVANRKDNDERFLRVQTILRSRYGKPETAIAYYRKKGAAMTKMDRLGLAVALGRTNDTAEAKRAFEQALAENGSDSLWAREAGRFYMKLRDFNRGGALLKQAVNANPKDMVASYEYADYLSQENQYAQAMALMAKVAQSAPEAPEVYSQYGRICGAAGDYFHAYLNMAYAAVYANDPRQSRMRMEKVRAMTRTEPQRREYDRLERVYKERSEYWPRHGMM
ncbi:M48 family metallopeptidase [Fundidesulfovibrio butyratiphilus]